MNASCVSSCQCVDESLRVDGWRMKPEIVAAMGSLRRTFNSIPRNCHTAFQCLKLALPAGPWGSGFVLTVFWITTGCDLHHKFA
jgi:hypothetical protein